MPDCRHMFLDHLCPDPVTSEQAAQQIMFPLPAFPLRLVLYYRGLKQTTISPLQQIMFPSPAFPQQLVVHYRGLTQIAIFPPQQIMFPSPAFPQQLVVHYRDSYLPSTANNVPIASFPTAGSCTLQRLDQDDYLPSTLSRSCYNENQPQYPNPGSLMIQTVFPPSTVGTMNTYKPNMAIFADKTCTFQQQTMEARTQVYIYQGMSFDRYFSIQCTLKLNTLLTDFEVIIIYATLGC